jgi:transcriptional antiterminator NusG
MEKKWRIIHFYGYSAKNIIKIVGLLCHRFGSDCVFCPIVKERRYNGKKRIFYDVDVPLFFGYVFLKVSYDPNIESIFEAEIAVRFQFLCLYEEIEWASVSEDDMIRLKDEHSEMVKNHVIIDTTIQIGDTVKFKSGPFANFTGKILMIFPIKQTAKISTLVFRKETPVEVPINSIERVS